MSMLNMIGNRRFDDGTIKSGTGISRITVLCFAAFLMMSPGCGESTTPDTEDASPAGTVTDESGVDERPRPIDRADIADIRDADGNPPQRPTLDPLESIQREDLDQLLGFLYWERDPNWRNDEDLSLLAWAAYLGRVEMAEALIRYGAEVDAIVRVNNTALHWAVRGDRLESAELLLVNGADPNARGGLHQTMTPLALAESRQYPDMIELLKRYGAR